MTKKNNQTIWVIIAIVIVIAFIWGLKTGKFQSIVNLNQTIIERLENPIPVPGVTCSLSINPSVITAGDLVTGTITDGKNAYCEGFMKMVGTEDWRKVSEGRTDINGRATYSENFYVVGNFLIAGICDTNGNNYLDAQDCVTNQVSLRVNPGATHTCTDTDGINKMTPGWVVADGLSYYDKCEGNTVREYYCNGDILAERMLPCDSGYECYTTRSGGYCRLTTPTWNPGDELNDEQGIFNNLPGQSGNAFTISPISGTGDLPLCAKLYVGAVLSGSNCIPGMPLVKFEFYDSLGKIWEHSDTVDFSTWSNPALVQVRWDGQTPFRMVVSNMGYCNVNVNSKVQLLICP